MATSKHTRPSKDEGKKPLTDLKIRRLKAGSTVADTGENRGLRVTRGKSGVTTFFYRYRSPIANEKGQHPIRQYKIGTYGEMSLNQARQELSALKAKRDTGICPAAEKSAEREVRVQQEMEAKEVRKQEAFTVEKCVEDYLKGHIQKNRKKKGEAEVQRLLYNDLVPVLGKTPVISVTPNQVLTLVLGIVNRDARVIAGSVLREFTAAIDYAIGSHLPSEFLNPCYQVREILKRRGLKLSSNKRGRFLSNGELSELLKWLPGSTYTATQKGVLYLTLMTGCRSGEVCNAMWRDIDLDAGAWFLRETKTDAPRSVQLSRQAVAFLRTLKQTTADCVFPSQKTGKPIQQKQLTEQAWRMRRDGKFLELGSPWTPHDLRRSVRTGLARMKCPSEVAEAVLGHTKGGIEGVYNLHSYEAECREWLQRWCDHMDDLAASDKVVALRTGA